MIFRNSFRSKMPRKQVDFHITGSISLHKVWGLWMTSDIRVLLSWTATSVMRLRPASQRQQCLRASLWKLSYTSRNSFHTVNAAKTSGMLFFSHFFEPFPIFVFYTYFQLYHLTMSTECTYLMQSSLRYLRAVLCLIGAKSSYSALGATGTP